MANKSVEEKLALRSQIQTRYMRDKNDMRRREQILYGLPEADAPYDADAGSLDTEELSASFPLRAMITLGLYLLLVFADVTGRPVFGISADTCFQAIATDYESSITRWVNAASNMHIHVNDWLTQ